MSGEDVVELLLDLHLVGGPQNDGVEASELGGDFEVLVPCERVGPDPGAHCLALLAAGALRIADCFVIVAEVVEIDVGVE